jgi:hypothetical protein
MNSEGCRRKLPWLNLRYYNAIFLDGLRKTTKYIEQDSRSLGRDLKQRAPEYETGVLITCPRCSAVTV